MRAMSYPEEYPYNLLVAARGKKILEFPLSLTNDVNAGIVYALSTLEKPEQDALDKKYRLGEPLCEIEQQAEKKALFKLQQPCRWDYICYGVVGCAKKKAAEAKRKGFIQGYQEGYALGSKGCQIGVETQNSVEILDLPIETMPLSVRVYNALHRGGCEIIRDVVLLDKSKIMRIRNLGEKGIKEIARVLHSYGITCTAWDLF